MIDMLLRIRLQRGFFTLFVIALLLTNNACNKKEVRAEISEVRIDVERATRDTISFDELYCDVNFIPLENHRNGMLSHIMKMIVTDNGYIMLNLDTHTSVLLFDHNGKFQGQVGGLGHGRGEYELVFDVSTDNEGNIVLSSFGKFLIYDPNGKYLYSKEIPGNAYMKNILCHPMGFVCASNYSGASSLLHFYDSSFRIQKEILKSDNMIFKNPSYTDNTLHRFGDTLCYYNPYSSAFTIVSLPQIKPLRQYSLLSNNIFNIEKAKDRENDLNKVMDLDYIDYYYLENGKIIGDFLYHHKGTYLEIDIRSDKYKLRVQNGWFPDISDVHNQYYYSILSQIDLLDLLNKNMGLSQKSKQMIISAYENMGQEITEKDNYVIMQLRKKS